MRGLCMFIPLVALIIHSQAHVSEPTRVIRSASEVDGPFPFELCTDSPTDLNISTLYVNPDPPVKGSDIHLELLGTVDEQLNKGSILQVDVEYSGVPIYKEIIPLYTITHMPVNPGPVTFNYSVAIPSIAPSGGYVVTLTFDDQFGTEIACISVPLSL